MAQFFSPAFKLSLILLASLLFACSPQKTAEEHYANAKLNIQNGKSNDAIISLKNSIKKEPNVAKYRIEIANVYLQVGLAALAEKEFERGMELGWDNSAILSNYAKSLILQDNYEQALDVLSTLSESSSAEILMYKAIAHHYLDEPEKVQGLYQRAFRDLENSKYTYYIRALINSENSDFNGAISSLTNALAVEPNFDEAILLKGQLHLATENFKDAIIELEKYRSLLPNQHKVMFFLAQAYIENGDLLKAKQASQFILSLSSNNPVAHQVISTVAYKEKEYDAAYSSATKAIQNGLSTKINHLLAGLSSYQLKNYESALNHLNSLNVDKDSNPPIQKMIEATKLKLGYEESIANNLENLSTMESSDPEILLDTATKMLALNNKEDAKKILDSSKIVAALDNRQLAKLGLIKLFLDDKSGADFLAEAIKNEPEQHLNKLILAAQYIKDGDFIKAKVIAEDWITSFPGQVGGFNLLAKIENVSGNTTKAVELYSKTLEMDPLNTHAHYFFVNQYIISGQLNEAQEHLKPILKSSPDSYIALEKNIQIAIELGKELPAIELIRNASIRTKNDKHLTLYAQSLYTVKDYQSIIDNHDMFSASSTEEIKDIYGRSLILTQNWNKANKFYSAWVESTPSNQLPWLRKIKILEKQNSINEILETSKHAISFSPSNHLFKLIRIHYLIEANKFEEAQVSITSLPTELKKEINVNTYQAEIEYFRGEYQKALGTLENATTKKVKPRRASIVFRTLDKNGKQIQAMEYMESYLKKAPRDISNRAIYASFLATKDIEKAMFQYNRILEIDPRNIFSLNNLAWLYYENSRYDNALHLAKKALDIAPNNMNIKDTLNKIETAISEAN